MGAAVALPFLEAMVPAMTALAQTPANPTTRFGAVFIPNGAIMEQWSPSTTGADFEFSPILKPLERFRDSLVVVSNLTRAHPGVVEGDHAISAAGWLTGVLAKRTEAEDVQGGTTIDQIVAGQIGQDTPFPSLELATADFTGYVGACTSGYSCVYTNTICVELADHAAADGDQPARGVRAAVRPAGHARAARGARSAQPAAFSISIDAAGRPICSAASARAIASGSASISTTFARSSAASSARKAHASAEVASFDAARSACRSRSRSTSR